MIRSLGNIVNEEEGKEAWILERTLVVVGRVDACATVEAKILGAMVCG